MTHKLVKYKWRLTPFLPLLWLYHAIVAIRNFCYDHGIFKSIRLPALVISIGNLSMGGTGKTPLTIFLAMALRDAGWRVAIVARGYRRQKSGLVVVSDGQRLLADLAEAGDEPLLMAQACKGIPVIVDRQKKIAAMVAVEKFTPDIILVDDGFQHRQLYRDIDIVMLEAATPVNNFGLSSGAPWREPISALRRADFIIINMNSQTDDQAYHRLAGQCRAHTNAAIFSGKLKAVAWRELAKPATNPLLPLEIVDDQPVMLVSGIARPGRFRELVEKLDAQVRHEMIFSDHHDYQQKDFQAIVSTFNASGARYILTTTKDSVKLAALTVSHESAATLPVLVLETVLEPEPEFLSALIASIHQKVTR
ncbi:MAG: tetraacyldisaccharide 4'-kinase [candidate division KSB1 bacterium]|nr:tetraacyldisaccharide 4'-kinase [candidate division KSB1 bacterium]MDZ7304972.1 tetraacyldisaccharide 4'-kinase [candidate division KSB1 bacterium]MDZ7313995.1 tetraacyldisaccharide 4'-kinase [candidate division KSB1 bacterium]